MSTTDTTPGAARAELGSFAGTLVGPDDAQYDEARALFNGMFDKRPALIAQCATAVIPSSDANLTIRSWAWFDTTSHGLGIRRP